MIRTVPFAEYEWYHSKLYCLQNAISYFCTWKLTEWHHFSNLVMEWLVNSYPGAQDSWTFSFPNSWEWKHVIQTKMGMSYGPIFRKLCTRQQQSQSFKCLQLIFTRLTLLPAACESDTPRWCRIAAIPLARWLKAGFQPDASNATHATQGACVKFHATYATYATHATHATQGKTLA